MQGNASPCALATLRARLFWAQARREWIAYPLRRCAGTLLSSISTPFVLLSPLACTRRPHRLTAPSMQEQQAEESFDGSCDAAA
jgi:hypothetical protein